MQVRSLALVVLVLLIGSVGRLTAQTLDIQQKIETELALKRLQGIWVPDLLLTTEGAEAYPLAGRALYLDAGSFARIEGKRTVATGTFTVEHGYLRLNIKDRSPWDLEAADVKDRVQYAFKVEGDLLTVCYSVDNKGKAGDLTPGVGRQVVLYKRQRTDGRVQQVPAKR